MNKRFREKTQTLLKEPLLHFLIIGALFYLIYGFFGNKEVNPSNNSIIVTAGHINWLEDTWQKRWNRPPTQQERQALIDSYVKENILYREALAMGLDKDDAIIRRRLAQKLEFLVQDLVALTTPTEKELKDYFATHSTQFRIPAQMSFSQVFFDPDKRGKKTLEEAKAIKAQLIISGKANLSANNIGDSIMLQNYYSDKSQTSIAKTFGHGLAASISTLSPGVWHGPLLSGYGVHLVYVHKHKAAYAPSFRKVKKQVKQQWLDDRRQKLNEKYYSGLRDKYKIIIENKSADPVSTTLAEQP